MARNGNRGNRKLRKFNKFTQTQAHQVRRQSIFAMKWIEAEAKRAMAEIKRKTRPGIFVRMWRWAFAT